MDEKRLEDCVLSGHLYDLACDLKMLKQLLREWEVGFPTPAEENVHPQSLIATAQEHLDYLCRHLDCFPALPSHSVADCYPLGEGRMTEEEYKRRKRAGL
jgi:hypothetical protein